MWPEETRAGPTVVVGRGPIAVERRLLADLEALLAAAERDERLLAAPVLVVVPSGSMRHQVAAALMERRGRPAAGLAVMTLHALARELVAGAGESSRGCDSLLPVLVQRAADAEGSLGASLSPLRDGYAGLAASVRDLLDAGFEPAHLEAVSDRFLELGGDEEVERALAVARVASAAGGWIERSGLSFRHTILRRAAEVVRERGPAALRARAVLVHGFAEATGLASDLLEALVRHVGARVYLDEPPDVTARTQADVGAVFLGRLRERLEGVAPLERDPQPAPGVVLRSFFAAGTDGEAREVARSVRELLDRGVRPEGIGVVARDLAPMIAALHRHFSRLGVPFTNLASCGSPTLGAGRLRALLEVVTRGELATVDAWLAARSPGDRAREADLRVGLRVCGALRLSDVVRLDIDSLVGLGDALPLPLRRGLESDGERVVAPRRKLAGKALRAVVDEARRLVERWRRWPASARFDEQMAALRTLLRDLSWHPDSLPQGLDDVVAELELEVPEGLELSRGELVSLLAWSTEDAGRDSLGGQGGGVQVMGVIEARGRTFEHLFVMGLNRNAFPRQVREDPLLPDRLRIAAVQLLPDLPVKGRGHDEERYLFAQLLAASPRVTLSWRSCDDEGEASPVSPFIERLRLAGALPGTRSGADLWMADSSPDTLRPAYEHAVLAGLVGERGHFAEVLGTALAQTGSGALSAETCAAAATARVAVLNEIDPDRRTREGRERLRALGPYLGLVGDTAAARRRTPAVTDLEGLAACPWQTFLRRLLRLEPPPDPLAILPSFGPQLVGTAVHRTLEMVARRARSDLSRSVEEAVMARPQEVLWPGPEEVEQVLTEACSSVVREAGIAFPGAARALAASVRPLLEVARATDWASGTTGVPIVAVEAEGIVRVTDDGGSERGVTFRADRIDRTAEGLRFTDYKSGSPVDLGKKDQTRHNKLLDKIRVGELLQAAGYAAAAPDEATVGRYLYLGPAQEGPRSVEVAGDDEEAMSAFREVVRTLLAAWDAGAFPPRLWEARTGREPRRCGWCEVAQACVRGDSGARRRLLEWAQAGPARRDDPLESAALRIWNLLSRVGEPVPEADT